MHRAPTQPALRLLVGLTLTMLCRRGRRHHGWSAACADADARRLGGRARPATPAFNAPTERWQGRRGRFSRGSTRGAPPPTRCCTCPPATGMSPGGRSPGREHRFVAHRVRRTDPARRRPCVPHPYAGHRHVARARSWAPRIGGSSISGGRGSPSRGLRSTGPSAPTPGEQTHFIRSSGRRATWSCGGCTCTYPFCRNRRTRSTASLPRTPPSSLPACAWSPDMGSIV